MSDNDWGQNHDGWQKTDPKAFNQAPPKPKQPPAAGKLTFAQREAKHLKNLDGTKA